MKDDDCSDISEVDPLLHSELGTLEFISRGPIHSLVFNKQEKTRRCSEHTINLVVLVCFRLRMINAMGNNCNNIVII